jgi:RNA polymerase sigma-70 factor (ECF subfamily)
VNSSVITLTDEELVARCKAELPHNTQSYELLVQRHMNRVYNIVFRIVNHREEAEDITQEVFVKVYNGLRRFDKKSSFSTWLYRIATNSALDAFDKTKRHGKTTSSVRSGHDGEDEIDALSLHESPMPGPEARAVQSELRECIHRVLRRLDHEQRQMLLLRDFEDLSYDEIASIVEAKLSAVKMRIHRARLAFQQIFNQFCGALYFSHSQEASQKTKKGEGL